VARNEKKAEGVKRRWSPVRIVGERSSGWWWCEMKEKGSSGEGEKREKEEKDK
jgi:hypothetical protein